MKHIRLAIEKIDRLLIDNENEKVEGLVHQVVIRDEVQCYNFEEQNVCIWDTDFDCVWYHRCENETFEPLMGRGTRTLYASQPEITLYLCSLIEETHDRLLNELSKIEYVQVISCDYNKPRIILAETGRLEKMNIEHFVSSITYRITQPLEELLRLC